MQEMLDTNASYLGIAVGVVLALGGIAGVIVYLSSIRPYQQKIDKTSADLDSLNKESHKLITKNEKLTKTIKERTGQLDQKYSEMSDQIESLTDSTKIEVEKLVKELRDEIARIKEETVKIKEDFEVELADLMIEYHKTKGQVGAVAHYTRQLRNYKRKGYTEKLMSKLLQELVAYINEQGIADYYVEDLKKELRDIENHKELIEVLVKAIEENVFDPYKLDSEE